MLSEPNNGKIQYVSFWIQIYGSRRQAEYERAKDFVHIQPSVDPPTQQWKPVGADDWATFAKLKASFITLINIQPIRFSMIESVVIDLSLKLF